MATTVDYIEFVMDSLRSISGMDFRYKKMFGEYCVYANDKLVLMVCDNTVYVKMLPCLKDIMAGAPTKSPYEGAKSHYILDIEDYDLAEKAVRTVEKEI